MLHTNSQYLHPSPVRTFMRDNRICNAVWDHSVDYTNLKTGNCIQAVKTPNFACRNSRSISRVLMPKWFTKCKIVSGVWIWCQFCDMSNRYRAASQNPPMLQLRESSKWNTDHQLQKYAGTNSRQYCHWTLPGWTQQTFFFTRVYSFITTDCLLQQDNAKLFITKL